LILLDFPILLNTFSQKDLIQKVAKWDSLSLGCKDAIQFKIMDPACFTSLNAKNSGDSAITKWVHNCLLDFFDTAFLDYWVIPLQVK
jgi:hypothetical protein